MAAENPTPPQGSGAEQVFGKMLAKVGISFDTATPQQVKKALDPVQRYMLDFNKTTDFKNSFFGKMPGIKSSLQKLLPDNARFLTNMMAIGNASKAGADGMDFYQNRLGFFGKGLTNLTSIFFNTGEGATAMGRMVAAGATMATLGIAALIALGIVLLQGFKNLIVAGIEWQDQLNDFSKMMGGISRDRLMSFNTGLNDTVRSLGEFGFSLGDITNTVKSYIGSGLNPLIALNSNLVKTTQQLSEVTGESGSSLASFFSGIMRGSKLTSDSLNKLGGNFTAFNNSIEASGVLGPIAFGDVKEAIDSVGTALLIASNKSKTATNKMMGDLVALTGLAKALNISVSDLNSKFEEAGNLISSQESGFRAILAISGGANIQNMLSNQFNKTEALLKVSGQLKTLNAQFGGNLNILGQVAEQTFGLSKDVAIKLATMSQEQRKALVLAKEDAERLQSDSLGKSFQRVTDTISASTERFKNVLINAFHRAFAGNSGLQNFLSKFGAMINRWVSEIGNPNSGFGRLVDKFSSFINDLFNNLSDWLDKLEPWIDKLMGWIDDVLKVFAGNGFMDGLGKILGDAITGLVKVTIAALGNAMPLWMKGAMVGMLFGPWGAVIGAGIGKLISWFSDNNEEEKDAKRTKALTDWSSAASKTLSSAIVKTKREQERLQGLKDTDIVVGKNGQFTLAGLERLEAATQEDKLREAQDKLTSVTEGNTAAIERLNQTLSGTGVRLNSFESQQPTSAPKPMVAPPAQSKIPASFRR